MPSPSKDSFHSALSCCQPDCRGPLSGPYALSDPADEARRAPSHGVLRCKRCHALYPYLAGAPLLLEDPARYLATYRDAILATLVMFERADAEAVALVDAFCGQVRGAGQEVYRDDWVRAEAEGGHCAGFPDPAGDDGDGASKAFSIFLRDAWQHRPELLLQEWLDDFKLDSPALAVDVGCGVGETALLLAGRAREVMVLDYSLRAVLTAEQRVVAAGYPAPLPVVCDATALPLRDRKVDVLTAFNLVDIMDAPELFAQRAAEVLRRRGKLILSTPDPDLGSPATPGSTADGRVMGGEVEDALGALLQEGGLRVHVRATVPWIRAHGSRHYEVYFADVVAASRA